MPEQQSPKWAAQKPDVESEPAAEAASRSLVAEAAWQVVEEQGGRPSRSRAIRAKFLREGDWSVFYTVRDRSSQYWFNLFDAICEKPEVIDPQQSAPIEFGIDQDPQSPTFGLRRIPSDTVVSEKVMRVLKRFQSDNARRAWRGEVYQRELDREVIAAAATLEAGVASARARRNQPLTVPRDPESAKRARQAISRIPPRRRRQLLRKTRSAAVDLLARQEVSSREINWSLAMLRGAIMAEQAERALGPQQALRARQSSSPDRRHDANEPLSLDRNGPAPLHRRLGDGRER